MDPSIYSITMKKNLEPQLQSPKKRSYLSLTPPATSAPPSSPGSTAASLHLSTAASLRSITEPADLAGVSRPGAPPESKTEHRPRISARRRLPDLNAGLIFFYALSIYRLNSGWLQTAAASSCSGTLRQRGSWRSSAAHLFRRFTHRACHALEPTGGTHAHKHAHARSVTA